MNKEFTNKDLLIDCLQYAKWSPKIFKQMRKGGLDCVHVTIAYHENFRETISNVECWNSLFSENSNSIIQAFSAEDILKAKKQNKILGSVNLDTAIKALSRANDSNIVERYK